MPPIHTATNTPRLARGVPLVYSCRELKAELPGKLYREEAGGDPSVKVLSLLRNSGSRPTCKLELFTSESRVHQLLGRGGVYVMYTV